MRQQGKETTSVRTTQHPHTTSVKILVCGGFGAGKTTLVGAVSEIRPLTTEEDLTLPSTATDDLTGIETKTTTTVAIDFGRLTLATDLTLYLFGTPGQQRFLFLWDGLAEGAIGALVLADTRRLEDCFPAVTYVEQQQMPFAVAVNEFDTALYRYSADEVREALGLSARTPVVLCDARDRASAAEALIALVEHALQALPESAAGPGSTAASSSFLGAPA